MSGQSLKTVPDSCSLGTGGLDPDIKQLRHDLSCLPPCRAEVKKCGAKLPFLSTPLSGA